MLLHFGIAFIVHWNWHILYRFLRILHTAIFLSNTNNLHTAIWYQVFISNASNLHTVKWYQVFLSNTNNLHTVKWYQVFLSDITNLQINLLDPNRYHHYRKEWNWSNGNEEVLHTPHRRQTDNLPKVKYHPVLKNTNRLFIQREGEKWNYAFSTALVRKW